MALLLTALWVASRDDYTVQRSASWWADMIGLPDPKGRAATRTIATNLTELARRGFIEYTPGHSGYSATVRLLSELGTGAPYTPPYQDLSPSYIRLPRTLWTGDGVIGRLSGAGLAVLVLVYHYYDPKRPDMWFSDNAFRQRHGMAEATRLNGLNDLVNNGVLTMRQEYVDMLSDAGRRTTRRRYYTLDSRYTPPVTSRETDSGNFAPRTAHQPPTSVPVARAASNAWGPDPALDDPF
ncbi:hypothetical protein A5780_21375 [Nocardia sp. 852002-20019_SCH5090214]|uniref:hypothetical protein n=1 Tax=Nocardia sp. 852002-20019_SCH5090214 TaxID=1834087 RepID=UPI0007E955B8|nr:hypothetical protein [Nocardia sp. 852002-20019_SCH5090214]OBA58657.1 hypothetical protein A5780_21375 [Nocardia sp. 852002-20019_SCH5090214]